MASEIYPVYSLIFQAFHKGLQRTKWTLEVVFHIPVPGTNPAVTSAAEMSGRGMSRVSAKQSCQDPTRKRRLSLVTDSINRGTVPAMEAE